MEKEGQLLTAVANSLDLTYYQDRDLRFTWVAKPHPPLTAENFLGKTDFDLLPPEEAERTSAAKRRVLATGAPERVEVRVVLGGQTPYFEAVY